MQKLQTARSSVSISLEELRRPSALFEKKNSITATTPIRHMRSGIVFTFRCSWLYRSITYSIERSAKYLTGCCSVTNFCVQSLASQIAGALLSLSAWADTSITYMYVNTEKKKVYYTREGQSLITDIDSLKSTLPLVSLSSSSIVLSSSSRDHCLCGRRLFPFKPRWPVWRLESTR